MLETIKNTKSIFPDIEMKLFDAFYIDLKYCFKNGLWVFLTTPVSLSSWLSISAGPHSFPHHLGQELRIIRMTLTSSSPLSSHATSSFCTFLIILAVFARQRRWEESFIFIQQQPSLGQNINCQTLGWEFRDGNVFRVWRHCARLRYCLLSASSYSRDFLKRWYNQMLGGYTNKIPVIPLLNLDQIVSATISTATVITRHFITWMFKI